MGSFKIVMFQGTFFLKCVEMWSKDFKLPVIHVPPAVKPVCVDYTLFWVSFFPIDIKAIDHI